MAIGQELEQLPAFRRHAETTAFVEGWGLYSERLADEMGLYTSDLDRIGMLSYDAWRASRLVVATGMHALAWSRPAAVEFMTAPTALGRNNIATAAPTSSAVPHRGSGISPSAMRWSYFSFTPAVMSVAMIPGRTS